MDAITELIKLFEKQNDLVRNMASNADDNSLAKKNINTAASDTPSNLKGNEKKRAKELSLIFVTTLLDEQRKREKDTKLQTKIAGSQPKGLTSIAGGSMTSKTASKNVETEGGGLLDMLKTGLLSALPFIGKIAGKIGTIFKSIGGAFKKLFLKLGSKVKGFFGKIGSAISKMWTKLKNSKIIQALKGYIDDAIKGIKGLFSSIKNKIVKIFKVVGDKISGLWSKITNSKAYKAMEGLVDDAVKGIKGFFGGIKNKIVSIIESITEGIKNLVPKNLQKFLPKSLQSTIAETGEQAAKGSSKGFFGKVLSAGKNIASKGVGLAVKGVKTVGSGLAKGASAVGGGVVAVGKGAASMTASAAKKTVSSAAKGIINSTGGMFKMMGRLTAKGSAKVPIIGPAIEAALATYDIKGMKEKLAKGEITEEQLQKDAGKRVITGVTGMLGSAGGAALAGALGSVIPVAGTALGAIAGGLLGDTAGRFLGGVISDYVIPPKYTKTIGAFVTGTNPPQDEMQDFIIKDGKVHKFSNKDEVMGMKSGGAINEFLRSQHGTQSALYNLYKINHLSAQYLRMIAQNTSAMARGMKGFGGGQSSPIVMNSHVSQPTTNKQMVSIPDNRDAYANSPYALG